MIDNSDGSAELSTYYISVRSNGNTAIQINPSGITMRDDDNIIRLNRSGIVLPDGDYHHVLTSNGTTMNMANYLQESDVSGKFAAKADRSDLITLEQKVTANTTASLNTVNDSISSLRVGLSKKQDKITVNSVDITDIETADITKLRTIVRNLIDALNTSGLIRTSLNIE